MPRTGHCIYLMGGCLNILLMARNLLIILEFKSSFRFMDEKDGSEKKKKTGSEKFDDLPKVTQPSL